MLITVVSVKLLMNGEEIRRKPTHDHSRCSVDPQMQQQAITAREHALRAQQPTSAPPSNTPSQ